MKKQLVSTVILFFAFFLFCSITSASFGFFGKHFGFDFTPKQEQQTASYLITLQLQNEVQTLPLEDYLYGVVSAEMPASFESEALKAQAVAARTYTINRARFPNKDHPNANVCADSAHCKAYLTPDELEEKFQSTPQLLSKIKQAVDDTQNQIAVYNGEPISAVFHSTSSGITENSRDVWGGDLPYLVSVDSPGEEVSPRYTETKTFTLEEFQEKINAGQLVSFTKNPETWFSHWEYNESGSVRSVSICGITFKGTQIRSLLGLRSTHFQVAVSEQITITTKGNGHGVGMSQYGANDMAKKGYSYEEILKKYYTGIQLANLFEV